MRDLNGRVGEVQIDLVYPHLLQALQTTPDQPEGSDRMKTTHPCATCGRTVIAGDGLLALLFVLTVALLLLAGPSALGE